VPLANRTAEYVVALTPLAQEDAWIGRLGLVLITVCLIGLVVELGGSGLILRRALRTVGRITDTAQSIAHSRDLSRRLSVAPSHDEIGHLATTFNEMLASLQSSATTQQRFVADASHELRAPLTAIQANLDLLLRHPEISASDRDVALMEAERESSRLSRLVADLLVLARADAGLTLKRQPVDLDAVVLDVFGTARRLAHGQHLLLDPFEPLQLSGDEDRLRQLLLILLENALKYTPASGQVTVGLRRIGDEAEIVVRDTGTGIDAADLPHVFERFYRADTGRGRDPGGTGLGLAIAEWIAQQHGGTINIESAPSQGTSATVRLPTSWQPPLAAPAAKPARTAVLSSPLNADTERERSLQQRLSAG
jgi:signal transduction histidine kinase